MLSNTRDGFRFRVLLFLVLLASLTGWPVAAQQESAAPLPFAIELRELAYDGLPGLHSFAFAQSGGKWLIVGGRTNGLHSFSRSHGTQPPQNAFPPNHANRRVWVIDPATGQSWSSPLQNLASALADALSATNAAFYQDGNYLFVIGGYGFDSQNNKMTTFGTLTALKVQETIQAVINGQALAPHIQQAATYTDQTRGGVARSFYFQAAGGGLEKVGNTFYLIFGQLFDGLYSADPGDSGRFPVEQKYTERVVALTITPEPLAASVVKVIQQDPNDFSAPYHRRDLNVVPALKTGGAQRISAYGGVFFPGRDSAFQEPIYLDGGENPGTVTVTVDKSYQQLMSQYQCATLPLFNAPAGDMFTVLFGGISLYYFDPKTGRFRRDDGLPFIDDITALVQHADGTSAEYLLPVSLPRLLGTNMVFVPNPAVPHAANGVLLLESIPGRTLVGHLYGGIVSTSLHSGPQSQNTAASNAVFEVWLTPGSSAGTLVTLPQ